MEPVCRPARRSHGIRPEPRPHRPSPTFPNARYVIPQAELDSIAAGQHAQSDDYPHLLDLQRGGTVEGSAGDEILAPGVRLEDAPGHNPGHHAVWVEDAGASAVIVGHLFLHPAQIAAPGVTTGDLDPALLERTRRSILARCAASDALLIGPLFASPGAGRVRAEGDTWRLEV